MNWDIVSFEGMGPIGFGMTRTDVASIIGEPERSRKGLRPGTLTEYRSAQAPIVFYRDDHVSEIQAFHDVGNVQFRDLELFQSPGAEVLRRLEVINGSARIATGIVLFDQLGLTTGRLDEEAQTEHSVTAFARGLWDEKLDRFQLVHFD